MSANLVEFAKIVSRLGFFHPWSVRVSPVQARPGIPQGLDNELKVLTNISNISVLFVLCQAATNNCF